MFWLSWHFILSISNANFEFFLSIYSAAARALIDQPLDAEEIAKKAMEIAADMCVYTNNNFMVETMATKPTENDEDSENESK